MRKHSVNDIAKNVIIQSNASRLGKRKQPQHDDIFTPVNHVPAVQIRFDPSVKSMSQLPMSAAHVPVPGLIKQKMSSEKFGKSIGKVSPVPATLSTKKRSIKASAKSQNVRSRGKVATKKTMRTRKSQC
jgi:hypothetical protein